MKFSIILVGTALFGLLSSTVEATSAQASPGIGGSSTVWDSYNTLNKLLPSVKTSAKLNTNVNPTAELGDNHVIPSNVNLTSLNIAASSQKSQPELQPPQFFFNRQYKSLADSIRVPTSIRV